MKKQKKAVGVSKATKAKVARLNKFPNEIEDGIGPQVLRCICGRRPATLSVTSVQPLDNGVSEVGTWFKLACQCGRKTGRFPSLGEAVYAFADLTIMLQRHEQWKRLSTTFPT